MQIQNTRRANANGKSAFPPDGKWRSFPTVPNLLQYVSFYNYYGRINVSGKTIRESLNTDVWSNAKLRLHDFAKKHQQDSTRFEVPGFQGSRGVVQAGTGQQLRAKATEQAMPTVVPSKTGNVMAGGV